MNKATFNTIKKISPARKSLPIIQHTAHVDAMGLTSTNLDTYIHVERPTAWRVDGAGVLSLDILAALIDARSVSMSFADGICTIDVDGRTIAAPYMESRDFPSTPDNDGLETSGEVYGQDLASVLDFISSDDFRPAMTGVYVGKHIVGTNGHILRYRNSNFAGVPFIIRREAVEAIKVQAMAGKMFKGPAQKWHVEQGREYVALYRNDITILTRKIAETYPNYLAVIPKDNEKTLTVDVKEMASAVKNTTAATSKTAPQVILNIDESGGVVMTGKNIDVGTESKQSLAATTENFGSGFRIGFSSKYLHKITSNVAGDSMRIEISEPNRAAIINNEMLLMPIMLNV